MSRRHYATRRYMFTRYTPARRLMSLPMLSLMSAAAAAAAAGFRYDGDVDVVAAQVTSPG